MKNIDWTKEDDKISDHFTVKEALWLPKWNRMATEDDGLNDDIKSNILALAKTMDLVRYMFNKPINIHCWFRPEEYNKLIGGAKNSAHKLGKAVDFDVSGVSCDDAKKLLMPKLVDFGLRMEDNGSGANWVHLDDAPVINSRFFKP